MTKEELINELLHNPLSFSQLMLDDLFEKGFGYSDLRECIKRIYDLSEKQLASTSNADSGMMGKANRKSTLGRKKLFNKKIKRLRKGDQYKLIYAEGDSWFQFPFFIKDIIDWLNKEKKYILYSDAYGGDWITNIIYQSQYISALSVLKPEYFLISGGGNDLVGDNRLATMIMTDYKQPKYTDASQIEDRTISEYQKDMIMKAQDHITKEFYAFLLIIKAQYLLLFSQIYASESTQKDIVCITQGYDYALPGDRSHFSFRYPLQPLVNRLLDNGCWLLRPLKIRGIFDEELQKALVLTFIYEFNQIYISIADSPMFKNVYHVDCRDLATSQLCWYDELHYKSHIYKKVAKAYSYIIDNHGNCSKVIRVADFC